MSEETFEVQAYRRIQGTTNAVRVSAPLIKRSSTSDALFCVQWRLVDDVTVVAMTRASTNVTTWFALGSVIVENGDVQAIQFEAVVIPPCFVYDGPENLTRVDLPPGVVVKEHLMEKVVFEARLDGGDHILVEMREADLLHKAYMVAKATKEST
jgi:translation initiation factor IF-1